VTSLPPEAAVADGPVGQGSLYGWVVRIVWLPRVTKRECTTGLPRESGRRKLLFHFAFRLRFSGEESPCSRGHGCQTCLGRIQCVWCTAQSRVWLASL